MVRRRSGFTCSQEAADAAQQGVRLYGGRAPPLPRFYFLTCNLFPTSHPQAAELAPALQADGVIDVKEAIQGAIQGENGEVVQIVTSVAT